MSAYSGITTILPVFLRDSRAGDLLRAADSVLSQKCPLPSELLVVDDGSQPSLASLDPLRSLLSRPDVRVLRLIRNQGLTYALNAGLTQARYDLIARIDADDVWRPGKLRLQCERMSADPDLSLLATCMRLAHPGSASLDRDELRGGEWPQALSFFALHGCPFPHASILARKDIFDLFGGYPHAPEFAHCEDFALWGSWVRFFKVATLPEVLLDYTVHPDQKSAVHTGHQQHGTDRVQAAFRALPQSHRIPEAVAEIAGKLNLPLLAASKVLCRAWMYHRDILVDRHLYEPAQVLFPDRSVHVVEEVRNVLADRVFYLHAGPADPAILQQFRVVRLP